MTEKKYHLVWKDESGEMVEDIVTAISMEVDRIGIQFIIDTQSALTSYVAIYWSDYPSMAVYDF